MKAIRCEMCFSTDLVKKDGVYVCQSCGTSYAPEEARKLMVEVEGQVDVSGSTVKVDNTTQIENFLKNARRAKEKEDWEEVEKYYNMVEQFDSTNIEAVFYSAYGKAMKYLIEDNFFKREAAFKVLQKCVSLIDDNYSMEKEDEEIKIVEQITNDIIKMVGYGFVYKNTIRDGIESDDSWKTYSLFISLCEEYASSLKNIISKYEDNKSQIKTLYLQIIKIYQYCIKIDRFSLKIETNLYEEIVKCYNAIKVVDPSFSIPGHELNEIKNKLDKEEQENKKVNRRKRILAIAVCAAIFSVVFLAIVIAIVG